eukprot:superscaffoldBa00001815_g12133
MRTRLILVCVSFSISSECSHELLENVDFPGTDIKSLYSPDVNHCQQLCTQHPSCLFFTFIRPDWTRDNRHFYCYLKSTPSGQPNVQTPLLGVTSGFSLKNCTPDTKPCLSQVYQNVDFLGADYRFLFTSDYEECQRACTQDPGCQFFTFVNGVFTPERIRYKCHLKFSWTIPRIPTIERKAGVVSGFSHKAEKTQSFHTGWVLDAHEGIDFRGSDISYELMDDPDMCQWKCTEDPNCQFYTYANESFFDRNYWRRCYLKRVITIPAPPKVTKLSNVVSGFSLKNCVERV